MDKLKTIIDGLIGFLFLASGIDQRYSTTWLNYTMIIVGSLIVVLSLYLLFMDRK